jgi:hypothetical protein
VVKAKIQMEEIEGNIKITGTAENLSEIIQSLTYKLSVIKQHSNNQSTNAQEGLFTLAPGEIKNLSTTQINTSKEDEIIVLLLFYDENKQLIGKDRVVLGNEKKKEENIILPDDGFILSGIISDETKTKMGKDFYDYFYYEYNEKNINSAKIVTVIEELSFGRNTKISISIENVVIYEFLTRPDEEFLVAVAKESVNATFLYLKNLERQSKYFTQY